VALERGRWRLCPQFQALIALSLRGLWKNRRKSLKQVWNQAPSGVPEWWFLQHLAKQFRIYVLVGLAATAVHYAILIGLKESGLLSSVPATLAGYLAGGVISYRLNRSHAFESDRPHHEALWRFVLVAFVGFIVTGVLMALLHEHWGLHYVLVQVFATGTVMIWSFAANKFWTFQPARDKD